MESTVQHREGWLPITIDRLVLTGADRVKFLHGFCTADIKRMQPGEIREAFVLNTKGKLVGHVQVLCREHALELVTWPGEAAGLREHLDRYLIREKVEFAVLTGERAIFVFANSGSLPETLAKLEPGVMMGQWGEVQLGPGRLVMAAGDFCVPGCLLVSSAENQSANLEELATWLETSLGLVRVEPAELESHRVSHAYPKFGVDADSETLPQELQRDRQAISFDKGCYLGQETVARIDALGHVNRVLVKVRIEAGELPSLPADLLQGELRVGRLTSAASRGEQKIGLGLVKRVAARAGTQLQCGPAGLVVE